MKNLSKIQELVSVVNGIGKGDNSRNQSTSRHKTKQQAKQPVQGRSGHRPGNQVKKNDQKKGLQTAFFPLNYPYVDLQDSNTIAISKKPAGRQGEEIRPIVYLNRPLIEGKKIVFKVLNTMDGESFVFIFGLTTCNQTKWRDHHFHVNEFCKDGAFECGGYSASIPVFVDDKDVGSVEIEKLEKGALCRLTTVFKNGQTKSRAFKDLTEGKNIEAAGKYYPFIIFEGFATKVRVQEFPVTNAPPRPIDQQGNVASSPFIPFTMQESSWVLGNGIGLASDSIIYKKSSGSSLYAICKSVIHPGQEFKFAIESINPNTAGTLTIGFTTIGTSSVKVDNLPEPNALNKSLWTSCPNVLASSIVGQEFLIRYHESGMQLQTNEGPFSPLLRKDQIKANTHLFFYFGGKVSGIKFIPRPPRTDQQPSQAAAAAAAAAPTPQPESAPNGDCLSCYYREATHTLVPCGHCCLCSECASAYNLPNCPFCRATIREKVKTFFPGRPY